VEIGGCNKMAASVHHERSVGGGEELKIRKDVKKEEMHIYY
jgi:hypothetical protein